MTARLWITVLGVALNAMHQRRARVLAGEVSPRSGEPWSALSIALAILIAIALGTGLLILG